MHIFFLSLSFVTIALWGAAIFFIFAHDLLMHNFFGLISTISCLITHCWVFFYFIGTGEGIREGIIENKLDTAPIKTTKKFKARTFPFALFSMIFMIVATVLGAGVQVGKVGYAWHLGFVLVGIAFNGFTFLQEFKVIQENRHLMEHLNQKIA